MKPTKASPTRNYIISSSSWLGKFITEFVPYAHVMLDDAKENYVLTKEEYNSYVVAAYADLKVPYEDDRPEVSFVQRISLD